MIVVPRNTRPVRPYRASTRVHKGPGAPQFATRPTSNVTSVTSVCREASLLVSWRIYSSRDVGLWRRLLLPDLFLWPPVGIFLLHELERSSNQAYLFEFDTGEVWLVITCHWWKFKGPGLYTTFKGYFCSLRHICWSRLGLVKIGLAEIDISSL